MAVISQKKMRYKYPLYLTCKDMPITVKTVQVQTRKLWMSQKEAQNYLGVSKDWLKARCDNGELHFAMVGKLVFYIKSEIDNLIRSKAVTGRNIFKQIR